MEVMKYLYIYNYTNINNKEQVNTQLIFINTKQDFVSSN